jgi:hypothetical protein
MFTPRATHKPTKEIIDSGVFTGNPLWIYNVLEDARIERLFLGVAPDAKAYFTATVLKLVIEGATTNNYGEKREPTPENLSGAFLLTWGRRYLGTELRLELRKLAENDPTMLVSDIDELADLIDEYIDLLYPTDWERGYEIVMRVNELLSTDWGGFKGSFEDVIKGHHSDVDDGAQGTNPNKMKVQRQARDAAAKAEEEAAEAEASELDDVEGDEDAEDNGGAASHESPQGAPGGASEGEDGGESQDEGENASDELGGGAGNTPGDPGAQDTDVSEIFERIQSDRARAETSVRADARELWRSVMEANVQAVADQTPREKLTSVRTDTVTAEMRRTARLLSQELEKLDHSMRAQWDRRRPTGRLNIDRAIRATMAQSERTDHWDRWLPDISHRAGAEVVIGVDISGSMNRLTGRLFQDLWVLRKAFADHDIAVHVVAFESQSHLWSLPGSEVDDDTYEWHGAMGGTEPQGLIEYATSVLSESDAHNRLLWILTDGEWWGQGFLDKLGDLTSQGIPTHVLYYDKRGWDRGDAPLERAVELHNASEKWLTDTLGEHVSRIDITCQIIDNVDSLVQAVGEDVERVRRRSVMEARS